MIFEFIFKDHKYFYNTECQFKITYSFSILEAYWKQNYKCEQIVTAQFFLIFFFFFFVLRRMFLWTLSWFFESNKIQVIFLFSVY